MERGMIGLGRMGTNRVWHLLWADHQCVVYKCGGHEEKAAAKQGDTA